MALSFVYKDLEIRKIVGESPKLCFHLKVMNESNEEKVIFKLSGQVNIGPRPAEIRTFLGVCESGALDIIPANKEEIIHLMLDMSWAKVKAIEDIRRGTSEIFFTIYLEGIYANTHESKNRELEVSSFDLIRGPAKSYQHDGTTADYIIIKREEWVNLLAELKYGEVKVIELPLALVPEPILNELETARRGIEGALRKYRENDSLGCVVMARNALEAITEPPTTQKKRRIKETIQKYVIESAPEALKDHISNVLDKLDDISGRSYDFLSKFVKEPPVPERPYHPPSNIDAEFSMHLVADLIRYLTNIIDRFRELKTN